MIKAVIFDFDGVFSNNFTFLSQKDFCRKHNISVEKFADFAAKYTAKLDKGKMSELEFYSLAIRRFKLRATPRSLQKFFIQSQKRYFKKNRKMFSLLSRASKNCRTVLLTNISRELASRLRAQGLYKDFSVAFFSYKLGMIKPNPAIFRYVLRKLSLIPTEAIFVDDNLQNVKTAEGLGVNSVLFTTPERARAIFKRFGIA